MSKVFQLVTRVVEILTMALLINAQSVLCTLFSLLAGQGTLGQPDVVLGRLGSAQQRVCLLSSRVVNRVKGR